MENFLRESFFVPKMCYTFASVFVKKSCLVLLFLLTLISLSKMITTKELQETLRWLREQGMDAQLCDTPVPYYDNPVSCGLPTDAGDVVNGEYMMLPNSLVRSAATIIVPVQGDSMKDAGFEDGDEVHVELNAKVRDGDIVVAYVDGGCTMKAYYEDEMGRHWLVPRNASYDAIEVVEGMSVSIVGKVTRHLRSTPRVGFRDLRESVSNTLARRHQNERVTIEITSKELAALLGQVLDADTMNSTDWIAVYRVLVDKCDLPSGFVAFADYINGLRVPGLPECKAELLRKTDAIYLRPVYQWTAQNAPSVRVSVLEKRVAIARALKSELKLRFSRAA